MLDRAEGYLELRMPSHALAQIEGLSPRNPHLRKKRLLLLGTALMELRRFQEALPPFHQLAEADPGCADAYVGLGWCYRRVDRLDLAIASMSQALSQKPDEAILHYNLSCYLSLQGDKSEAIRELARALELDDHFRGLIAGETDFDALRAEPDFQALMQVPPAIG